VVVEPGGVVEYEAFVADGHVPAAGLPGRTRG